jgi:hypothetical protein
MQAYLNNKNMSMQRASSAASEATPSAKSGTTHMFASAAAPKTLQSHVIPPQPMSVQTFDRQSLQKVAGFGGRVFFFAPTHFHFECQL